jgi:hypothetical protein
MGYEGARLVWNPDAPTSRVAYWGAPQTIEVMAQAVLEDADHFETRMLAEMLCEGLDSKDYTSEYLACYYCVLQSCRYMRDPRRTELVRAPYVIARQILAGRRPSIDCDDAATLIAALDQAIGGSPQFVTVAFDDRSYDGQRQYSHVYTQARDPRRAANIVQDPVAAEKTSQMLRRVRYRDVWPIVG